MSTTEKVIETTVTNDGSATGITEGKTLECSIYVVSTASAQKLESSSQIRSTRLTNAF